MIVARSTPINASPSFTLRIRMQSSEIFLCALFRNAASQMPIAVQIAWFTFYFVSLQAMQHIFQRGAIAHTCCLTAQRIIQGLFKMEDVCCVEYREAASEQRCQEQGTGCAPSASYPFQMQPFPNASSNLLCIFYRSI